MWDHGETGIPVAGPGAPLVAEFSVTEFAAAIGLPTEAGQGLPRRGRRAPLPAAPALVEGDQGRPARLAGPPDRPRDPHPVVEAAAHVDHHVAHTAHKVRPAQVDRLVEEAIGRFMPEEADRRRRQAADGRYLHHRHPPALADRDQHRVRGARPGRRPRPRRRRRRRRPGPEGPRLHRHPGRAPATAVGDLARRQLTLDLNTTPDADRDPTRPGGPRPATATRGWPRPGQPRGGPASRVRW